MDYNIWNKEDSIFENFAKDLVNYTKTGKLPESGDQDVHYYMELQGKRLKKRRINMSYDITPRRDLGKIEQQNRKWSDEIYTNKMEWHPCALIKGFTRDEKNLYKKEQKKIFYQYITYAKEGSDMGEKLYTCPSCGTKYEIGDYDWVVTYIKKK